MTGLDAPRGDPGTLEAVRLLEQAMEGRTEETELAAGRLAAAVSAAEEILAAARAAGTEDGRQRRSAMMLQAKSEAAEIRSRSTARGRELQELVCAERSELVTAMMAIVLRAEA